MLQAIISWLKRLFGIGESANEEAHIGYEAASVEQELLSGWIKDEPDARDQIYVGKSDTNVVQQ